MTGHPQRRRALIGHALLLLCLAGLPANPAQSENGAAPWSLTLPQAIAIALDNNPVHLNNLDFAEMAQLDLDSARAIYNTKFRSSTVTDARSGAETGSAYSLYLNKQNPSGSSYAAGFYNYNFGDHSLSEFRVSYTLPWFRDPLADGSFAIEQKEMSLTQRQLLNLISQQELINLVVASFYQLALAIEAVEVSGLKLAIAERLATTAAIRASANLINSIELAKIQLQLKRARQQAQAAAFNHQQRLHSFHSVLGLPAEETITIENTQLGDISIALLAQPVTELESLALASRAEVIGKQEELAVMRKKLALSGKRSLTGLDLSLQYALVGESDRFSDSLNLSDQRVGVGLNMDTDFGTTDQERQNRQLYLRYQTEMRNARILEDNIKRQVNDAVHEVGNSQLAMDIASDALAIAEQEYNRATIRRDGGSGDDLEVLQTQIALEEARFDTFAVRVNYLLAGQKLVMAVGKFQ